MNDNREMPEVLGVADGIQDEVRLNMMTTK